MYYGLYEIYRMLRVLNPCIPPWVKSVPWVKPVRKSTPPRYNAPWLRPRPHRNRARDKLRQHDKPKQG